MGINKKRNIVILKDLPSNLVEEAFVVLKENQKIPRFEYAENQFDNFSNQNSRDDEDEYVVKEAELLVSNYISKLENQDFGGNNVNNDLIKKCNRFKKISIAFGGMFLASMVYILNF